MYFAGRRLLQSAPTIPLAASLRVVVGIFSYDGNLQFGITGDYDSAADIGVLRDGIERGIAELVAIAGPPATEAPATTVNGEPAARPSPAPNRRRGPAAPTTA
jgi:hypothetical protein